MKETIQILKKSSISPSLQCGKCFRMPEVQMDSEYYHVLIHLKMFNKLFLNACITKKNSQIT